MKSLRPSSAFSRSRALVEHMVAYGWSDYTRVALIGDVAGWAIGRELAELGHIWRELGARPVGPRWAYRSRRQSIFYGSHFKPLLKGWPQRNHHIGMAYFHGLPGTRGEPIFDAAFAALEANHERISRVQVTHAQMRDCVLSSGISEDKVHLIRIGLDVDHYPLVTPGARAAARREFDLPEHALLVGSFQKDGQGWGKGLDPKLVKGPDILVRTMTILNQRVGNLMAVLSGPARGYVRRGLREHGVAYRSFELPDHHAVSRLYRSLDAYLVASRQEGGPKAILESMSSGIPIISTRVGQAPDLIEHGDTGWLTDVDDVDALAHWTEVAVRQSESDRSAMAAAGRSVAENNTYRSQLPQWRRFLEGFTQLSG